MGVAMSCMLSALWSLPSHGADKYLTYGAISVFGANQSVPYCAASGGLASARLAIRDRYDFLPKEFSSLEGANSLKFTFSVGPNLGGGFEPAPPLRPLSMEAWRTFTSVAAGTWDFVSIQKLSTGERLSDAIRLRIDATETGCRSPNIKAVDVTAGDLQVSSAGRSFSQPVVTVKVVTQFPETASVGASAVLASEVIFDEALDTGIDGPKTALLTDNAGNGSFAITPGSKPGVKRFVVKARNADVLYAASTIVTLIHAPIGAPVANSVPIVEYRYDGGSGARTRFLTGAVSTVQALDARDEANRFTRTGQVWRAFTDPAAAPGLAPVCQFFGRFAGSVGVSHFFTANVAECASLRSLWGDAGSAGPGLKYEGIAFYAVVPDAQGRCPSAYPIAIKRYFETQPAPYHLYLVIDPKTQEPTNARPNNLAEGVAFCTDVATAL